MALLKIVPEPYLNLDALENLIHKYLMPKAKTYGALGVNPRYAAEQMKIVKGIWNQTGGKQLWHFILSFSPFESKQITHAGELIPLAYEICTYFEESFQILFAVHRSRDGESWHIHFCVNTVSYVNGKRLPNRNRADWELRNYIQSCCPYGHVSIVYY